jgi:hypothetical protein
VSGVIDLYWDNIVNSYEELGEAADVHDEQTTSAAICAHRFLLMFDGESPVCESCGATLEDSDG